MASASSWQQYFPRDTFSPCLGSSGSKSDISLKKLREKVRTVLEATSYARNTNTLGESCFAQLFYLALCLVLASFRFRFLVRARFPSDVISLALLRLCCSFVYILTLGQFLFVTISQPDFDSRFV